MTEYAATHTVPTTGLEARERPDPGVPAVARLDPRLDVQVVRTWGRWAEVRCANGWGCWVDADALVALAPLAPLPQPVGAVGPVGPVGSYAAVFRAALSRGRTPADIVARGSARGGAAGVRFGVVLVGALTVVIGALLPWLRLPGLPGFGSPDFPVQALVGDLTGSSGPISIAVVLITAAVVAAVAAGRPALGRIRRVAGWLVVVIATVFVAQVQRNLTTLAASGPDAPTVLGTIGLGVVVAFVGGLLIALGPSPKART